MVRHGEYVSEDNDEDRYLLSDLGKAQMDVLSRIIKDIAVEDAYLVTSPERVALESAKLLADKLGLSNIETSMHLWAGDIGPTERNYMADPKRVHDFLMSVKNKSNVLIVVTHGEILERYLSYFWKNEMNLEDEFQKPKKGHMVHFNINNKTYKYY